MSTIVELDVAEELHALFPDSVLFRLVLRPGDDQKVMIKAPGAGAYLDPLMGDIVAAGEPETAASLATELIARLGCQPRELTVPQPALDLLPESARAGFRHDWTVRWTKTPPPVTPAERLVIELDPRRDADEITELFRWHPWGASTKPENPSVHRWVGIRDGGELVACGADTRLGNPDAPYQASLVTHPRVRRQGYGSALVAYRSRRAVAEYGISTVIHFNDNERSRRLYDRAGYCPGEAFSCVHRES